MLQNWFSIKNHFTHWCNDHLSLCNNTQTCDCEADLRYIYSNHLRRQRTRWSRLSCSWDFCTEGFPLAAYKQITTDHVPLSNNFSKAISLKPFQSHWSNKTASMINRPHTPQPPMSHWIETPLARKTQSRLYLCVLDQWWGNVQGEGRGNKPYVCRWR